MTAPDIAAVLASGIPRGLTGVGIDRDALTADTRIATFHAAFSGASFDAKTGGVKVTFLVPSEHQLLALGIRDLARTRLVLEVHSGNDEVRGRYGRSHATSVTPERARALAAEERVRENHARRTVKRLMRDWTGPDAPTD